MLPKILNLVISLFIVVFTFYGLYILGGNPFYTSNEISANSDLNGLWYVLLGLISWFLKINRIIEFQPNFLQRK